MGILNSVAVQGAENPVVGDERAVKRHLSQAEASTLSRDRLQKHGEMLFRAKFTILDGAGRPFATQAEIPTKRELGFPSFFRTSGPEANACDSCHNQPTTGGAGDFVTNVFSSEGINDADFDTLDSQFSNERGTPLLQGSGYVELLAREMSADLQKQRDDASVAARKFGTKQVVNLQSKGVFFGKIVAQPDGFLDVSNIEGVDFDLVVRPFSQKGVFTSLRQFTINALNAHHGIQSDERYGRQWTNSSDFDGDGVVNEISTGDITAIVAFQATLVRPSQNIPKNTILADAVKRGGFAFENMGCNRCHRAYMPLNSLEFQEPNPFNNAGNLRVHDKAPKVRFALDDAGLKRGPNGEWIIPIFSDLKRHRIADDEHPYFANEILGQRYIPRDVFITTKLWGVGQTAPYGHRGDVTTLREVILHHGGEAKDARKAFEVAGNRVQNEVIEFLKSLHVKEEVRQ